MKRTTLSYFGIYPRWPPMPFFQWALSFLLLFLHLLNNQIFKIMYKKIFAVMAICMGIGSGALYAQVDDADASHNLKITVPNIMLLDIEGVTNNTVNLGAINSASQAEAGKEFSTENLGAFITLNYSSIVPGLSSTRRVSVKLSQVRKDNGIALYMNLYRLSKRNTDGTPVYGENNSAVYESAGNVGVIVNGLDNMTTPFELTNTSDFTIINNIGSCYTGDGFTKGFQVFYFLKITDVAKLRSNADLNDDLSVTYTIADN